MFLSGLHTPYVVTIHLTYCVHTQTAPSQPCSWGQSPCWRNDEGLMSIVPQNSLLLSFLMHQDLKHFEEQYLIGRKRRTKMTKQNREWSKGAGEMPAGMWTWAQHSEPRPKNQAWWGRDRLIPGGCWTAIIVYVSFWPVRDRVSKPRCMVPEEWQPKLSCGFYVIAHMYINTCMHTKTKQLFKVWNKSLKRKSTIRRNICKMT